MLLLSGEVGTKSHIQRKIPNDFLFPHHLILKSKLWLLWLVTVLVICCNSCVSLWGNGIRDIKNKKTYTNTPNKSKC